MHHNRLRTGRWRKLRSYFTVSGPTHPSSHWRGLRFWTVLAVLTILAVFVLPLHFPPSTPTYSVSYVVGFNNRLAAGFVVLLSLVTLLTFLRGASTSHRAVSLDIPMPKAWLLLAIVGMAVFVGVMGGLALQTQAFESDAAYFLTQLAQWSHFHLKLYRDLEFGYGPLLFAWPAAVQTVLRHAGIGPEAAYLVSLVVLQILGLCTTFYLLQKLPLHRSVRGGIFLILTLGAMRPSLGLNYTLLRFTSVFAALLAVSNLTGKLRQGIWFAVCQVFMLAISPEMGVAFLAGTITYALFRSYRNEYAWISVPVPGIIVTVWFCLLIDPGYFYTMRQFATGMLNQVVAPTPEILVLLIAAIGLAPLAVAASIERNRPDAAALLGIYVASLALVPAALGLCDPLHTFFNGIGFYLLSFVALASWRPHWSKLCLLIFLVIVRPEQINGFASAFANRRERFDNLHAQQDQVLAWEKAADGGKIFAPTVLPYFQRKRLLDDGLLRPDYFSGLDNAFNSAAEKLKLDEMRASTYVLAARGTLPAPRPDERRRLRLLRFGYTYPVRHVAYVPLQHLQAELSARGTPLSVATGMGTPILYRLK